MKDTQYSVMEKENPYFPFDGSKLNSPPTECVGERCERPIMARGMCSMHYYRFQKNGTLDPTKPSLDYKARYARWENFKKRYPNDFEWKNFSEYNADVGVPPGKNWMLYKKDESKPFGKNNFEWHPRKGQRKSHRPNIFNTHTKEGKKAYDQYLLKNNPDRNRNNAMKRNFGITITEYNLMLVSQKACCAICKNPETQLKKGKLMQLSIDHDHATGKIRGLLCSNCNRAIGLLKDNVENLRNAISYLNQDEKTKVFKILKAGE